MKRTIIIIIIAIVAIIITQDFLRSKRANSKVEPKPYVIMLSLNGFRWDYQSKVETPNLDYITKHGVKADGLKTVFPSTTFPNYYSIATGLYPENHGIISNSFFAKGLNKYYSITDKKAIKNSKFYKGEPIWVTAESQKVKSGSFFWVGSDTEIKGYYPSYRKAYGHNFPYSQRIDSVISWLNKPQAERPHLITWYMNETDDIGHKFGPDGTEINKAISLLDSLIGVFIHKVNQLPVKDSINFIVVSDHGMSKLNNNKVVYLNQHVDFNWIDTALGFNPFILIYPKKKCIDSIYNALKDVEGITTWKKEQIPERFHLKQSPRLSDIVVVADSSWSVSQEKDEKTYTGGTHGYDNNNSDMNGVFYSIGPAFKENYNAGLLHNVDIYSLITNILNISPAKTDGKPQRINHILKNEKKE